MIDVLFAITDRSVYECKIHLISKALYPQSQYVNHIKHFSFNFAESIQTDSVRYEAIPAMTFLRLTKNSTSTSLALLLCNVIRHISSLFAYNASFLFSNRIVDALVKFRAP